MDESPGLVLSRVLAEHEDAPAIVVPGRVITRGELAGRTAAMAAALANADLDPASTVGVSIRDDVDHLSATVALLLLGVPSLSLPTFEPEARRARLAVAGGVRAIVGDSDRWRLPLPGIRYLDSSSPVTSSAASLQAVAEAGSRMANPMYRATSGTTGEPKVFGITDRLLMGAAERISRTPREACVLRTSSGEHDGNRLYRVTALLAGSSVAIAPELGGSQLADFCSEAGVTEISAGTPGLVRLLDAASSSQSRLPSHTGVITGGTRVPAELRAAVMNRLTPHLRVSYATSEVGVISIAQPDEHRQWPDGVGHPIPGVEVEVRDEHGVVVPRGERGNPWVRKAGAAHAGLEEVQGWLRIPDIVSWPDGAPLQFHGRADDLITMNTIGVFPAEIEDVLGAHPAVLHVAAYGVESNRHGQIPVAAVVLRRDVPAEESELLDYARRSLGLRSPRAVFFVDELPRNANGKVLVRALPRRH